MLVQVLLQLPANHLPTYIPPKQDKFDEFDSGGANIVIEDYVSIVQCQFLPKVAGLDRGPRAQQPSGHTGRSQLTQGETSSPTMTTRTQVFGNISGHSFEAGQAGSQC